MIFSCEACGDNRHFFFGHNHTCRDRDRGYPCWNNGQQSAR